MALPNSKTRGEVPENVKSLVRAETCSRIAALIRKPHDVWSTAIESPQLLVQQCLSHLGLEADGVKCDLVVVEAWDFVDVVVFDLWNSAYDFATAHHPQDLPVVMFQYGRKGLRIALAGRRHQNTINHGVAEHFNNHGWQKKPPYFVDHTMKRVPSYSDPRDVVFAKSATTQTADAPDAPKS